MTDTEEWREVPGWPDYAVSDIGRVKRLTSRTRAKAGSILKAVPRSKKQPYLCVCLCLNGKVTLMAVHQIVMLAFRGPPAPGQEINHEDGRVDNPRLDNLEYTTSSGNQKHAYATGLQDAAGEKNGQAVLTEADVIDIRASYGRHRGEQAVLARKYGVDPATIRDVIARRTWAHI